MTDVAVVGGVLDRLLGEVEVVVDILADRAPQETSASVTPVTVNDSATILAERLDREVTTLKAEEITP